MTQEEQLPRQVGIQSNSGGDIIIEGSIVNIAGGDIYTNRRVANASLPPSWNIPIPPRPYYPHSYVLTRRFAGRRTELAALNEWSCSDDTVCVVEAIGGVGKSALTWHWVQNYARRAAPDFVGIMWWSFYEGNATVTNFIRHALAYIMSVDINELRTKMNKEYESILLRALQQKRYLLVLDGLERILVAYHRGDASRLSEEQVEHLNAKDYLRIRKCIDPRYSAFLRSLVNSSPSKILISTRLLPQDLQDPHTNELLPSVRKLSIKGLGPQDALLLMRQLGIFGNPILLKDFMSEFEYHPLLLGTIAGRILDYRPAPKNFDVWYHDEGRNLHLSELDLAQRRTHILQYALDGLKPELRKLISQIAAFRYPVEYAALKALNPYLPPFSEPEVPPLSKEIVQNIKNRFSFLDLEKYTGNGLLERLRIAEEILIEECDELKREPDTNRLIASLKNIIENLQKYRENVESIQTSAKLIYKDIERRALKQFDDGLRELENRGLLQWDQTANLYDLHPIIRAYAYEQLEDADRKGAFTHIRDHFMSIPPENLSNVQELSDLRRTLEIYNAMVGARLFEDASSIYQERLKQPLETQLAAHYTIIELLTPLFPNGLSQPPSLSLPRNQSARINDLANAYRQVGESAKAIDLETQVLKIELNAKDTYRLCIALYNYQLALIAANQLATAFRVLELVRSLAEGTDDAENLAFSSLCFFEFYTETGQWRQAREEYEQFKKTGPYQIAYWQASAEKAHARMLIYQKRDSVQILDRAWELAVLAQSSKDQLAIHMLKGENALQQKRLELAVSFFQDAVDLAQKLDVSLADYLSNLARAYALQGQMDEARRLIEQALNEGESDQNAAEVYSIIGETDRAKKHAIQAYQRAWADGPPFSWQPILQRAKQVLRVLKIPEPIMPSFNQITVQPIPYEQHIRRLSST